jgi:hypothetical protein
MQFVGLDVFSSSLPPLAAIIGMMLARSVAMKEIKARMAENRKPGPAPKEAAEVNATPLLVSSTIACPELIRHNRAA